MNGNNVHTSVVLRLSDEEEPKGGNTYKIDLEDVERTKEYVIDEIFCDDEIAVYAVFDASSCPDGNCERSFKKLHCSNFNELRFSQRQSYKKNKNEKARSKKPAYVDSEERIEVRVRHRRGNFNYSQSGGVCARRDNSPSLEETFKCLKLKSISKGVNTDINQSPKLLEEVREAVSLNFSKLNEKNAELSSVFSIKSSHDLREIKTRVSSTTFSVDGENGKQSRKSYSNIVIVPVIIKDEELCNFWWDNKSQQLQSFNRSLNSKIPVVHENISVSTSTELMLPEQKNNEATEVEPSHCKLYNNGKLDEKETNRKTQEYLIEEIKSLQEKFNVLLKSLESRGFSFAEKKETTEVEEYVCISTNNFDKISVFSSNTSIVSESKESMTSKKIKEATSLTSLKSGRVNFNIDVTDIYDEEEKILLSELMDWEEVENRRGVQLSKSQTRNRCVESKNTHLKRSLSLDLDRETLGAKKLKNIFFKLEGSIKKEKSKAILALDGFSSLSELSKAEGHMEPKSKTVKKDEMDLEITENPKSNRTNSRTSNADSGDVKDTKITKKGGIINKAKAEPKITTFQEEKQTAKSDIRRVSGKDSPQSKLPVNLFIKTRQNCEQKKNNLVSCNSTRLPRASFQKKDKKMIKKEEKKDIQVSPATKSLGQKNLQSNETKSQLGDPKNVQPTSTVVVELFSKKPASAENFSSEVDLQDVNSKDVGTEENHVSGESDISKNCQNVVKSVWALTKVLLYEDGTKKMEVLEASLSPPDYCFNKNLTEDKER